MSANDLNFSADSFENVSATPTTKAAGQSEAELAALVEQALNYADDLGLIFVAIDLCSALEKLKQRPPAT